MRVSPMLAHSTTQYTTHTTHHTAYCSSPLFSHLVSPVVHQRHRKIVHKDRPFHTVRGTETLSAPLIKARLDVVLKHPHRRGGGEVHKLG